MMKPRKYQLSICVFMVLLCASELKAQFSLGVQFGGAGSIDSGDSYSMDLGWLTVDTGTGSGSGSTGSTGNNSGSGAMVFNEAGGGTSLLFNATWEVSKIVGISFIYQNTSFNIPDNQRSLKINSLGVLFKFNFVKNTQSVVPFIQVGYLFSNASTLKHNAVTSVQFPTQAMPAFEQSYSSNLGLVADLGAEIKLSQPFSLVIQLSGRGVALTGENDTFAKTINVNTKNPSPNVQYKSISNFDGSFWIQATGGIKYYFGKSKKKRDF